MKRLAYVACFLCIACCVHRASSQEQAVSASNNDCLIVNGGVGVQLSGKDYPRVDEVFENTPAWNAGIRKGDIILSVDGAAASGMLVGELAEKLHGMPGTKVVVEIQKASTNAREKIELIRAVFRIP